MGEEKRKIMDVHYLFRVEMRSKWAKIQKIVAIQKIWCNQNVFLKTEGHSITLEKTKPCQITLFFVFFNIHCVDTNTQH